MTSLNDIRNEIGAAFADAGLEVAGELGIIGTYNHEGMDIPGIYGVPGDILAKMRLSINIRMREGTQDVYVPTQPNFPPVDVLNIIDIASSVGSAAWAAGVVTLTMHFNIGPTPDLTALVGRTVTVAGVNNDNYDGDFVITGANQSAKTLTYALAVNPGGNSFGGTVDASITGGLMEDDTWTDDEGIVYRLVQDTQDSLGAGALFRNVNTIPKQIGGDIGQ